MALPKIDTPVYEIDLPVSKIHVRFRPFLVKEQKNLLMAMEAEDTETINNNIRQILSNCTLSELEIDEIPIVDVEYYFLHLRARSVGEIVEANYRCNVLQPDGEECGNSMKAEVNILDINIQKDDTLQDIIKLSDNLSVKMKYPQFSTIKKAADSKDVNDMALQMVVDSIDTIYDTEQSYSASEVSDEELKEFVESLNIQQFKKIEEFFDHLPKLDKTIKMKCSKCGFEHQIYFEGLESFFD